MIKKTLALFIMGGLILTSCSNYNKLIKTLPESDQIFMAEVKYLMSKEERNIFLSLPSQKDRIEFKIKFWKERDTDRSTEVNEFKEQYYARMELANKKFTEGNKEGWQTERGRIYMLLGPPDMMMSRPGTIPNGTVLSSMSISNSYQYYPHIIWMYGNFPIFFVDHQHDNSYQLETRSARSLAMINYTLENLTPQMNKSNFHFDFRAGMRQVNNHPHLHIRIPLEKMLFDSKKKEGFFVADFSIFITFFEKDKIKRGRVSKRFQVTVDKNDKKKMNSDFYHDFKLNLKPGKYMADITINNNGDEYYLRKKVRFKI